MARATQSAKSKSQPNGQPLARVVMVRGKNGPLDLYSATQIIAAAAERVHAARVDETRKGAALPITPSHIVVDTDGRVELVTKAPMRSGYSAPEALSAPDRSDARSDVFSLGVILWEVLTRRRLFFATSDAAAAKLIREVHISPPSKHRNEVPFELDDLCLKALERDPARRFASAFELHIALETFLRDANYPTAPSPLVDFMRHAFTPGGMMKAMKIPAVAPKPATTAPRKPQGKSRPKAPSLPLPAEQPGETLVVDPDEEVTGIVEPGARLRDPTASIGDNLRAALPYDDEDTGVRDEITGVRDEITGVVDPVKRVRVAAAPTEGSIALPLPPPTPAASVSGAIDGVAGLDSASAGARDDDDDDDDAEVVVVEVDDDEAAAPEMAASEAVAEPMDPVAAAAHTPAPAPDPTPIPIPHTPATPRRRTGLYAGIGAAFVLLIVVLAVAFRGGDSGEESARAAPVANAGASSTLENSGEESSALAGTMETPEPARDTVDIAPNLDGEGAIEGDGDGDPAATGDGDGDDDGDGDRDDDGVSDGDDDGDADADDDGDGDGDSDGDGDDDDDGSATPPVSDTRPDGDVPDRALARKLYSEGLRLFVEGNLARAKARFKQALDADPRYAPSWRGLGFVYEKSNRAKTAVQAFKKYLRMAPGAGDANTIRAKIAKLGG